MIIAYTYIHYRGNICYVNATLQSLPHVQCVAQLLMALALTSPHAQSSNDGILVQTVTSLLKALKDPTLAHDPVDPTQLFRLLQEFELAS